ncbi:hypothetical protein NC652_029340 [Populus alba x Populus x berolinensis]|nr:hypothetical protein NC652_029340 [Populus alba x Populus x berolinensis]
MKRALLTNLSVCTRKLLLSPTRLNPNPSLSLAQLTVPTQIKKLVEKYYEGEDESLPLIFEAIINRKLAGIPDDKLIEQLNLESPPNGFEDKEFDFDFEDKWSETDEDGDDLD